jgi:uncharacterized Zn finger protein (UPF0148 family)
MTGHCAKCNAALSADWRFCPMCGAVGMESEHGEPPTREKERSPEKGAFSGLLMGVIVVPMLLIVGTLLCLTGLGAILGVPMIVAGILAPLVGPLIGMRSHQTHCPYCGTSLSNLESSRPATCPVCNQKVTMNRGRLEKAA